MLAVSRRFQPRSVRAFRGMPELSTRRQEGMPARGYEEPRAAFHGHVCQGPRDHLATTLAHVPEPTLLDRPRQISFEWALSSPSR